MSELLVLHAVRVRGFADERRVSQMSGLPESEVSELLLDFEACGWVSHAGFAGSAGWSLTEAGRQRDELLLAGDLERRGARAVVQRAYDGFLELNAQFLTTITRWQLGDHDHARLDDLAAIVRSSYPLLELLVGPLPRFTDYRARLSMAISMATTVGGAWVDGVEVDSLHRVWFELHEDLLATLGLSR